MLQKQEHTGSIHFAFQANSYSISHNCHHFEKVRHRLTDHQPGVKIKKKNLQQDVGCPLH